MWNVKSSSYAYFSPGHCLSIQEAQSHFKVTWHSTILRLEENKSWKRLWWGAWLVLLSITYPLHTLITDCFNTLRDLLSWFDRAPWILQCGRAIMIVEGVSAIGNPYLDICLERRVLQGWDFSDYSRLVKNHMGYKAKIQLWFFPLHLIPSVT